MRLSLFLFLLLWTASSCSINKIINHKVDPADIKELSYFEPVSYIALIEKGNQGIVNDSLSSICTTLLDSIIMTHKVRRNMSKIEYGTPEIKSRVQNEIGSLVEHASGSHKLDSLKLTPTIDSLLQALHQRFAFAVIATGFGRSAGNYENQIAKGAGIGILTLGMVVPIPYKSSLDMYAIVMDAETNGVIYYCRALPVEKSPTNKKAIYERYANLFNGYLYK